MNSKHRILLLLLASATVLPAGEIFDLATIRDPSTLKIEVLQDWHRVNGPVATRQKLVTINVGKIWPGQDYRVPVRMVVPADGKARGFHLTGSHNPRRWKRPSFATPVTSTATGICGP